MGNPGLDTSAPERASKPAATTTAVRSGLDTDHGTAPALKSGRRLVDPSGIAFFFKMCEPVHTFAGPTAVK
jgi:hypothetical protein